MSPIIITCLANFLSNVCHHRHSMRKIVISSHQLVRHRDRIFRTSIHRRAWRWRRASSTIIKASRYGIGHLMRPRHMSSIICNGSTRHQTCRRAAARPKASRKLQSFIAVTAGGRWRLGGRAFLSAGGMEKRRAIAIWRGIARLAVRAVSACRARRKSCGARQNNQ